MSPRVSLPKSEPLKILFGEQIQKYRGYYTLYKGYYALYKG